MNLIRLDLLTLGQGFACNVTRHYPKSRGLHKLGVPEKNSLKLSQLMFSSEFWKHSHLTLTSCYMYVDKMMY